MKKRDLNLFDAGIAFIVGFLLAQATSIVGIVLSQTIMQACGMSETRISAFWDTAWGYLIQALFMNVAFVIIFIWYYKRRNKQTIIQKPTKPTLKYFGYCVLLGVGTLFLLSGVLNYFQLICDKIGLEAGVLPYSIDSFGTYIISLISLAVLPAICEELLFRGVITTALKPKGKMFAVVVSSIIFSIFHFSPSQLIYPICFGLILGIVYLRTNNIIFPILLHFVNNALSISIQYFSSSTGEPFTHSTTMLVYAILTFAMWVYFMIKLFKDFKNHISIQKNLSIQAKEISNLSDETTETTNSQPNHNSTDKNDEKVLYISLILMAIVYILMIFA